MNSPIGNCMPLLLGENDATSNVQNPFTFEHRSEEDEEDEEGRQCDDDSVGAEDVHNDDNQDREGSSPFLAVREAIEREQMRYVAVDGEGCNLSNNPDTEDLDDLIELSPMQYHLAPSPQFENVENIGHVVSSEWTPWGNTLMGHPTGEFIVGQIFTSKGDLQHAVKMYSINSHQEYIVLSSTKKLLVLRLAAIQASVVERFGYHISYTKASKGKRKALTNLFGDFYKSYAKLPHFFGALEQANPGCIVISKTFPGNMRNEEVLQRVFWAFHPSIEGFKHCHPVLTIDGTHLYGKYKGTVMIAMGCDGNNQLFPLAFALTEGENVDSWGWFLACIRNRVTQRRGLCVISDRHPGIMAAFADVYLSWSEPNAYHQICMRHLASNFMTHFKDKCLKQLLCRAALETKVEKFNMHMETIGRINQDALSWLEVIPFEKWALSHDGGRRYGIMTTNMSEMFNSVLKGARSFPITAFVQLTFYRVNSYFVVRREHGVSRLASGEQYTPYVDAKINANVVKAGSHEVVLYDHFQGLFHVKGSKKTSSGGRTHRVNLREHGCTCGKTLIYGFSCSHFLAACHFRSIDFRSFVQHYYTIQSYFSTCAPLFNPIHNEYEWPPYVGPVIVPADSMKRVSGGRPKSTHLHNEMDVREGCLYGYLEDIELHVYVEFYLHQFHLSRQLM
ncbi:uncharacterized protein LOC117917075 [Vitis riparia]|uniref:uncharacterized protein LOC117917075 n=1 Tax=Vitis riparia TaxID=96939 RepID=UPI00155AB1A1|nr:uncharacterized protein LOC117917075 [Vitis riparia]